MLYQLLLGDQVCLLLKLFQICSFKCFEEVSEDVVTESFQDILAPKIAHRGAVSLATALFA